MLNIQWIPATLWHPLAEEPMWIHFGIPFVNTCPMTTKEPTVPAASPFGNKRQVGGRIPIPPMAFIS